MESFKDKVLWSYSSDYISSDNLKVHFRSLFNAGIRINNFVPLWKAVKNEYYREYLFDIILKNLWHEGFLNDKSLIVEYPKHLPYRDSNLITQEIVSKFSRFGSKHLIDVLSRWKQTQDKSYIRSRRLHSLVSFEDEINSLVLWNQKIIRDRVIILIDDFTTTGLSLEAGRNLFMRADVDKIVLCSFGKFSKDKPKHKLYELFDSFNPFIKRDKLSIGAYKTGSLILDTNLIVREELEKYLI